MPETIKIFFLDSTYDGQMYPGLDETKAYEKYKQELEDKLNIELTDANIGAGADLPAYLLELMNCKEGLILLALFFSGKKIKWIKNPDYIKAYQDLEPEFTVASTLAEARTNTGLSQG